MQTNNKMNIDFNKAWNSLKPELDKEEANRKKKKRRFIVFWFSLIAITVGGGILLTDRQLKDGNMITTKSTEIAAQKELEKAKNITLSNQQSISNSEVNESVKQTNNFSAQQKKSTIQHNFPCTKEHKTSAQVTKLSAQVNNFSALQNISSAKAKKSSAQHNFSSTKANKSSWHQDISSAQANKSVEQLLDATAKVNANTQNITSQSLSSLQKTQINTNAQNTEPQSSNNSIANNNKPQNSNSQKPTTDNKKVRSITYGLQFNLPIVSSLNTLDANAQNNIATIIIPTAWVNKSISKKQSLQLFVNPYSNYYVSNKAIVNNTKITTTTQQATQTLSQQNTYNQTIAVNKLIGLEAGLLIQHKINSKLNVGLGISYFATQSMLLKNVVIKNNNTVKNEIFSVGKTNTDWQLLQANFLMANFEFTYQFKKLNAGINLSKPLSNIFSNTEISKTPINTNLFVRWKIK